MAKNTVDIVHTGPGTPAGQYLRQFWQPVYRVQDMEPGWAKQIEVMNEFFTLYRGDGGEFHLVEDRCPHRKTRLSIGWVEGDDIRCLYHGWKFAPDGACVEQPVELESFKNSVCIRSYPVREYLGLVFAYLGEGEEPVFPRFPEAEEEVEGTRVHASRGILRYNYFQRLENELDETHVHFVHRAPASGVPELSQLPVGFEGKETDYGILRLTRRMHNGQEDIRHKHFMMPNIGMTLLPPANDLEDYYGIHLAWRVPKNDSETYSIAATRQKIGSRSPRGDQQWETKEEIVDAIFDGERRIQDLDPYHPRLFNIQDDVAMGGQGSLYDSRDEERLGRSDTIVALLRRIYQREISNMLDGQPQKHWKRPEERLFVGHSLAGLHNSEMRDL